MISTDALKYLPQMGLDPSRVVGCVGAKCQNSFARRMDSPSRQLSQRNVRSSSSVRLDAISTRSHRSVLRGRDETAGSTRLDLYGPPTNGEWDGRMQFMVSSKTKHKHCLT